MSSGETDVASTARPKKSSASITELELAFAQDPQSSAYVPLCEAYLDQSRFMEAMVVAKKGLKAHPASVEARLLLASVYARQQKYPRALQEADEVVAQNPTSAAAHLGRGKIRFDSGDDKGAVTDLKKAIDLDPTTSDATELLKKRGIIYPEPPPPPPPPVAVAPAYPPPMSSQGQVTGDLSRGPAGVYSSTIPRQPASASMTPPLAYPNPVAPPSRPRLEGEDELEKLAVGVGELKREGGGSARGTIALAVGALLITVVGGGVMFHNKRVTEGIAELSRQGRSAFLEDTYGSYQRSASAYEEILKTLDADHPATLGALAHTYAILWGEHGAVEQKAALDRVLALAVKRAPDNPHTISARGLVELYGSDNRQKAAAAAYAAVWPAVKALREQNQELIGTFADLTLGIIDMEAGNYTGAASALQQVVGAIPGSVRAKVAYARAAHRTGDLGKAEVAFSEALNVAKDHPGARAGRALVRLQRGRLDPAAQDLVEFDEFAKKAPKQISDKDRALAEYARSEVIRATGDEGSARAYYENALRFDPGNAEFPYGLGRSYLANGRAKEAIAPLTKALEREPNRRAFMVALAEAQTATGDYGNAEKNVTAALAQDGRDISAALARGRLLVAQKKPDAESYLKEVLGWSKSGEASLELGRLYAGTGKTNEAKVALEAAADAAQNQPPMKKAEIALEYGKLMSALEDDATALSSFKQAAEWGAMEGWFRAAQVIAKGGSKKDKDALKAACERYLGAGSLPYTQDARALCGT